MTTQHDDDASHIEASHAHEHEDQGGGHGHGADPNAGVVVGTPPTQAWVMTAAGIGLVTIVVTVILAVMLHDAADDGPGGGPQEPAHGRAAVTMTVAGS